MLLDFHLARRPIAAGEQVPDRIGGTTHWMAPEHRAALEAVSLGKPVPQAVDHRADLYSLGLLLSEALGGPDEENSNDRTRPTRPKNPEVSPGLADLVAKCLAERPSDRYPSAAALAEDLRRHINDLPLRIVPNRSWSERWRKLRRRRPEALVRRVAWSISLVSAAAVIGLVAALVFHRVQEIQTTLDDAQDFCLRCQFSEAIHTLGHGLQLAATLPWAEDWTLTRSLHAQLDRARRGRQADGLHHLADRVRFRYGIEPPTPDEAAALLPKIRAIWDARELLLAPKAGQLDAQHERQIRTDLLELMIVWADLRTCLAPPAEADTARVEAGRVLDEARDRCRPHLTNSARLSAAEHYDLGRSLLRAGVVRVERTTIQAAAKEFQRTLEERPLDFWPNFYWGLCAYRLGEYPDAYAAFGICAALAPGAAECFFNRALAAEAMGRIDQALRDYHAALERDGNLTAAWLNRGILAYKSGRHPEAVADFQRALETSPDARTTGRIHYNRALVRLAQGDRAGALADAEQARNLGCDEARDLCARLRPESQQHPDLQPVVERQARDFPRFGPRTDLASHGT
jgi:tetratricopeptide (TPR) repeat protein